MPSERIEITPDLAALSTVADRAEACGLAAGLDRSSIFAVLLCLEEAISNVIRHGRLAGDARIRISIDCLPDRLSIEIADPGIAFDPLHAPPPPALQDVTEAAIGGRGRRCRVSPRRAACRDHRR